MRLPKLTSINLSSENFSVQEITSRIRKSLKPILINKGGELKNCGMRDWRQIVELDAKTGFWRNRSMIGKPKRWILHATPVSDDNYCVETPRDQRGSEHIGYFSNVSGTMMIMAQRIIIGVKNQTDALFQFDPQLEWVLFIAMRQSLPRGTSCEIIKNLDLSAGTLGYEGQANIKSAKVAGLCLVAPTECLAHKQTLDIHESLVTFLRRDSNISLTVVDDVNRTQELIAEFCSVCECNIADPTPEQANFTASFMSNQDDSVLSDTEEQMVALALLQDCRRIVLWGPDVARMSVIRQALFQRIQKSAAHIMANHAWTEDSVLRVIRSQKAEILSFEQAEHLVTAGLLPIILDKTSQESTLLFNAAGVPVEPFSVAEKFSHLVLSFTMAESRDIRKAHLMLGGAAIWIKCASRINSIDVAADFLTQLGASLNETDRRSNAFSNMGKVLEQHIYIDAPMLINFMKICVTQHPEETWGADIRGQTKAVLISAFNIIISPRLADLEQADLLSLLNEISNTWELSLAQSQFLISSNFWH